MKNISVLGYLILHLTFIAQGQTTVVPEIISFADIRVELTANARKKVQTDVDALTRYEKYFNAKVDRIDAYFPLIEQVLREENVPEDIKYLVVQESALVGDAVSSSNAIGYWQFKVAAAEEVGLTINSTVDERMNIITATRGAARYFKNNNALFDNWLHALMAYYEGPGGALKKADKRFNGKKVMRLDGKAHWYVLKYLSHKIAFESAVGKNPNPPVQLFVYQNGGGKTLRDIANEFRVTEDDLQPYNTWLKQRKIPQDKSYPVIIPDFSGQSREPSIATNQTQNAPTQAKPNRRATTAMLDEKEFNSDAFPLMKTRRWFGKKQLLVNGIPAAIAKDGEDVKQLSRRTGVAPSKIIKFNNLGHPRAAIVSGQPYYLRQKHNRAPAHYHIAEEGENWWDVSQRFGIKLNKLLRNNRLRKEEPLQAYQVLWLRYIRPATIAAEFRRPAVLPANQLPESVATASSTDTRLATTEAITTSSGANRSTQSANADIASEQAWRNSSEQSNTAQNLKSETENAAAYHTVRSQETLYSIARQHNISAAELAGHNQMSIYDSIQEGQKLLLPASSNVSVIAEGYHEVKAGETMYQIAQQYNISIRELMEWNQKESFNLKAGEQLRIAASQP